MPAVGRGVAGRYNFDQVLDMRAAEIRGTLFGSLVEGNPTTWGKMLGVPCFRKPLY